MNKRSSPVDKILIRIGGVISLLFVLFHLAMVKPIGEALASLSPDIRATVSTLNIHVAFTLLIFAYLAFFQWRDLLTTRLGNITTIAIIKTTDAIHRFLPALHNSCQERSMQFQKGETTVVLVEFQKQWTEKGLFHQLSRQQLESRDIISKMQHLVT